MTNKTLAQIWTEQRSKIAFLTASLPLIAMTYALIVGYQTELLIQFGMAAIACQVAFVIAAIIDTQKLAEANLTKIITSLTETQEIVENQAPKEITKINENTEFWNGEHKFRKFYLNALNGKRFYEKIIQNKITVDRVRVIVPSVEAITVYYNNDMVVTNPSKSIEILTDSLNTVKENFEQLITVGTVKEVEFRELATFPLDLYAIFDGKYCLVGKYLKDQSRRNDVGVKSLSWVEKDKQLVSHHNQHFDELWDSLRKEDESTES